MRAEAGGAGERAGEVLGLPKLSALSWEVGDARNLLKNIYNIVLAILFKRCEMVPESLVAKVVPVVIAEPVKRAVIGLYEFLLSKSASYVEKWRAERGLDDLYKHISSFRSVKTIWQIDKAVDLGEFFVPPHVKFFDGRRVKASRADTFNIGEPVLLEGIAGQGKSTLMRHLCSGEMIWGETIPVFLELRRIKKGESVFSHICRFLEILGVRVSKELFLEFLQEGKVSLYFDGFDEVESDVIQEVVSDIEMICLVQNNCRIVITSRPNQSIKSLPCLTVARLDNLIKDEYKEVVFKISENKEYAEALIKKVDGHSRDLKGMLCTPLFVTLLVISYKSYQHIPDQLSDFYDSLFRVLLQRHDGTKPAYSRLRNSGLNDIKFKDVFECFCYETKRVKRNTFTGGEVDAAVARAIEMANATAESVDVVGDIETVTCLLMRDVDEWRFIHKSIQEYFSASYIRNKPEVGAKKIYEALSKKYLPLWEAELRILSEIDTYRYAKFFYIPCAKRLLRIHTNLEVATPPDATNALIKSVLGCYKLTIAGVKRDDDVDGREIIKTSIEIDDELASPLHEVLYECVGFFVNSYARKNVKLKHGDLGGLAQSQICVDFSSLVGDSFFDETAKEFVRKIIRVVFNKAREYEEYIKRVDSEQIDYELFG